ncbi:MAG: hypothetical protein HKN89_01130, partial [Eudoraea sp.]|nr:hypothetical protein [Eudoraea sp.]
MIYHPLHKERNSNLSARFFKRPIHLFFLTIAYLSLLNCSEGTREQKRYILHQPEQSGVTFQNTLTSSPDLNILNYIYYYNGAGVASADFNNDGLI